MKEDWDIEKLLKCPVCEKEYANSKMSIIEENERGALVYMKCKHCKASVISSLMQGTLGIVNAGVLTDLASEEVYEFFDAEPITTDEVLDFYQRTKKK